MNANEHGAKQSVSSYAEWAEHFRPERAVGDAVVLAFLLKNISDFKEFVNNYKKSHQVAAQKWIADSLYDVQRFKQSYECAKQMKLPNSYLGVPEVAEWKVLLKKESEEALIILYKNKN